MNIHIDPPHPKQLEFFKARSRYVAYGGARSGGKSWALRALAVVSALKHPGIRILIVRRTYQDLYDNHVQPLKSLLGGAAKYSESHNRFYVKNGSEIIMGYYDSSKDAERYQGKEYDIICIDEATQMPEDLFDMLKACCRGANDYPKRIYLTCNPGGVGHAWVKRLFVDCEYRGNERAEDYTFISAKVYDNPTMAELDPEYVKSLETISDPVRRAAWLDGDWDVYEGQFFTEFSRDKNIVDPFVIPDWWRRFLVFDYGLDMFAAYVVVADNLGNEYVVAEDYQSGLIISLAIERLRALAGAWKVEGCFAPPDMWGSRQETGQSFAELAANAGLVLIRAKNNRLAGWIAVKERLYSVDDAPPKLRIFPNCRNLIRCIPLAQYDTKIPNDIAREPHEITHSLDALRYFCATRYTPAAPPAEEITYHFKALRPKRQALGRGERQAII